MKLDLLLLPALKASDFKRPTQYFEDTWQLVKNKVLSKYGGDASSSSKPNPTHQDDVAMDYLYKTKTKSELNFLKRQVEKDVDTVEKKAKLSHKQNIEKYNSYLAAIPEQNELRRINWHKH